MLLWTAGLAIGLDAFAQAPAAAPGAAPDAGPMYLTAATTSVRFLGDAVTGPAFEAGEPVTVLVRDGDKARVFAEERFGWIDAALLTATAPAPTGLPPGLGALPPGLTLPGGGSLLGELPPGLVVPTPPMPAPTLPTPNP